jgi:hypothetical protein
MANVNITVPINGTSNLTFVPIPRLPEQVVAITDDPNPLSQSGVTHPPVTRSVTLPLGLTSRIFMYQTMLTMVKILMMTMTQMMKTPARTVMMINFPKFLKSL